MDGFTKDNGKMGRCMEMALYRINLPLIVGYLRMTNMLGQLCSLKVLNLSAS